MGKAEFGTAKYQSKQLKASGLQKLKYYCQICEKQCRDANGFKNHIAAPSHHFRVKELSESGKGNQVIEEYSRKFTHEFLRLLRINHGTKKINANKFYQEYIMSDRDHIHMNSTKWTSLTAFVKYLGNKGEVRVENEDSSEFNLEIRLVDNSQVQELQSQKSKAKTIKTDEEVAMKLINEQIERGKKNEEEKLPAVPAEPISTGPVKLTLKSVSKGIKKRPTAFEDQDDSDEEVAPPKVNTKSKIGIISKRIFDRK